MDTPPVEGKMQSQRVFVLQFNWPYYWPIATNITSVAHAWGMRSMKFMTILSTEAEMHTKSTLFLKQNVFNYWSIAKKITPVATHACLLRGVRLQENPSHGKRDTAEKVIWSPHKVHLIIKRSKQNLPRLLRMRRECMVWSFDTIIWIEAEI